MIDSKGGKWRVVELPGPTYITTLLSHIPVSPHSISSILNQSPHQQLFSHIHSSQDMPPLLLYRPYGPFDDLSAPPQHSKKALGRSL